MAAISNNEVLFLREALDRSSALLKQAEEVAAKAQAELQKERTKSFCAQAEVHRLNKIVELALQENKRLRNLMGEVRASHEAAAAKAMPPVESQTEQEPDPFAREPEIRSEPLPPPPQQIATDNGMEVEVFGQQQEDSVRKRRGRY